MLLCCCAAIKYRLVYPKQYLIFHMNCYDSFLYKKHTCIDHICTISLVHLDMVVRRHEGGFFKTVWGTWDDFWQETNIAGT